MTVLQVTQHVDAGPGAVWQVIADLDAWADIIDGIHSIERLDDIDGFGVGTRWRETRVMFGREATEEMTVTSIGPGRYYTATAASHGMRYESIIALSPAGDGTDLTMTFKASPDGPAATVLALTIGALFKGASRKAMAQDLADIAAAAESRYHSA